MNVFTDLSQLTQEEFEEILHFDAEFFDYPWTRAQWEECYSSGNYLISYKPGYGFCLFHLNFYEQMAHLLKILVLPEKRTLKIGFDLYQSALVKIENLSLKKLYLEVAVDNIVAINFYEKLGFKKLKLAKKYYSDGKSAWSMLKLL